jgi:hypothetical protein
MVHRMVTSCTMSLKHHFTLAKIYLLKFKVWLERETVRSSVWLVSGRWWCIALSRHTMSKTKSGVVTMELEEPSPKQKQKARQRKPRKLWQSGYWKVQKIWRCERRSKWWAMMALYLSLSLSLSLSYSACSPFFCWLYVAKMLC